MLPMVYPLWTLDDGVPVTPTPGVFVANVVNDGPDPIPWHTPAIQYNPGAMSRAIVIVNAAAPTVFKFTVPTSLYNAPGFPLPLSR